MTTRRHRNSIFRHLIQHQYQTLIISGQHQHTATRRNPTPNIIRTTSGHTTPSAATTLLAFTHQDGRYTRPNGAINVRRPNTRRFLRNSFRFHTRRIHFIGRLIRGRHTILTRHLRSFPNFQQRFTSQHLFDRAAPRPSLATQRRRGQHTTRYHTHTFTTHNRTHPRRFTTTTRIVRPAHQVILRPHQRGITIPHQDNDKMTFGLTSSQ